MLDPNDLLNDALDLAVAVKAAAAVASSKSCY